MARLPRALSSVARSDARRLVTPASAFVIVSGPTWSLRLRGQPISFPWLILAFGLVILLVVAGWGRRPIPATSACTSRSATTIAMALASVSVLVVGVERWVDLILWNPLDPIYLHPPPSAWRVGANELLLHSSTSREPHGR